MANCTPIPQWSGALCVRTQLINDYSCIVFIDPCVFMEVIAPDSDLLQGISVPIFRGGPPILHR